MSEPGLGVPVITLDGPSGSGKGTIARVLARRLGWHLLDSGALYRLTALAAARSGVSLDDPEAVAQAAQRLDAEFGEADGTESIRLHGEDVTAALRTESCGEAASRVAAIPEVRRALLARQRAFAVPPGLVADGRDMGNVVFPGARLKVFLTASPEERARRRHKQLKDKGIDVSLRDLSREIAGRDERDARRPVSPLVPAEDARIIDSTRMTPEQVAERILQWLREAGVMAE